MGNAFLVGELARMLGVEPRRISVYLYNKGVDEKRAPIVAGRRLIPRGLASEIKRHFAQQEVLNAK